MNPSLDSHIASHPVSKLSEFLAAAGSRKDGYRAIVNGKVYFDLNRDLVTNDDAPVYRDQIAWEMDQALRKHPPIEIGSTGQIKICVDAKLIYEEHLAEIIRVDPGSFWVKLPGSSLMEIKHASIPALIAAGRMKAVLHANSAVLTYERLAKATTDQLATALERFKQLELWIEGSAETKKGRTQRRLLKRYQQAEASAGSGLLGLLSREHDRGNRTSRLMPAIEQEIASHIECEYLTVTAPSVATTLRILNHRLREKGLPPINRKTLVKRIQMIKPEVIAQARHGHKVANAVRPPHELVGPSPHGDRAFEVGHIDSTQLDVEVTSERTGASLGRPWVTVLINANPSMPLGWHISMSKPDSDSVLMALRDCVRRYSRLPDTIVCDLGSEHSSISIETLCAAYSLTIVRRPRGNPRFGPIIESYFNTINKYFIHQLKGSVK